MGSSAISSSPDPKINCQTGNPEFSWKMLLMVCIGFLWKTSTSNKQTRHANVLYLVKKIRKNWDSTWFLELVVGSSEQDMYLSNL